MSTGPTSRSALAACVVLCIVLLRFGADAANASEPHPHQGIIPRLKVDGIPKLSLSKTEWEKIEQGHLWLHSEETDGVGSGLGIRDIAAPWEVVFGQISDLKGYVGKVPMLSDLKVYSSEKRRGKKGAEVVEKATYTIKVVPGYKFEYFLEHHAVKAQKTLLFFLDYQRNSDFQDMQGKWFLEEHPTKPGWTRVYYQCELMLWGYAPAIVKTLLTSKGLSSAIGWVKHHSESRARKTPLATPEAAFAAPVGLGASVFATQSMALAAFAACAVAFRAAGRRRLKRP